MSSANPVTNEVGGYIDNLIDLPDHEEYEVECVARTGTLAEFGLYDDELKANRNTMRYIEHERKRDKELLKQRKEARILQQKQFAQARAFEEARKRQRALERQVWLDTVMLAVSVLKGHVEQLTLNEKQRKQDERNNTHSFLRNLGTGEW
jgi:hypothetical protein